MANTVFGLLVAIDALVCLAFYEQVRDGRVAAAMWVALVTLAVAIAFCVWVGSGPDVERTVDWNEFHDYVMEVSE